MAAYLKKPFSHNPLIARKPLIRVTYETGLKVSDEELAELALERDEFARTADPAVQTGKPAADDGHEAVARCRVLCGSNRMSVAPSAPTALFPTQRNRLWLFPGFHRSWRLGEPAPSSGNHTS